MLAQTKSKEKAYRAIINTWLKADPRNLQVCRLVIEQNKMLRQTRLNKFASTKDKNLRWGISLPPGMYQVLQQFERMHERKFMVDVEEVRWFARTFPPFAIPEVI